MIEIIAEIGINWDGNFELVKEMIKKAKNLGCNLVKFQAFDEKIIKDHPQKNRLLQSSVNESNVKIIDKLASSAGIEWFCTPMYSEAVDFLEPFVNRFKIREFDGRILHEKKNF